MSFWWECRIRHPKTLHVVAWFSCNDRSKAAWTKYKKVCFSLAKFSPFFCSFFLLILRLAYYVFRFVVDIFRAEGKPENLNILKRIPLLVPKVPQQINDQECGNFVLYFINLFMENAPQNFSMDSYPYFMEKNWFAFEALDCFIQKLYSSEKWCPRTWCSYRSFCKFVLLILLAKGFMMQLLFK